MTKKKILFADDEPAVRARLQVLLAERYQIAQAENGCEAIEKLKEFKADIVLLDIDMPVMNGLETCKKIRQSPSLLSTKIIIVSGEITLKNRLMGYEAGADDYLTKPVDKDELIAKIEIMLRLKYTEEIDKILMDFVNLFYHESRTPLNGIIGFAKIISSQTDNEKTQEQAEMILKSGNNLINFSNKVTLLCNIKRGLPLNLETTPAKNLLVKTKSVVEQFDRVKTNIHDPGEQNLLYDWDLLQKAIDIIINNALRYTPADKNVLVTMAMINNFIVIEVIDHGPGLPPQLIDHIFEPFTMPEEDVYSQPCAHISLAFAFQIIELHDGDLKAANHPEGGAVFTIRLPLIEPTTNNSRKAP